MPLLLLPFLLTLSLPGSSSAGPPKVRRSRGGVGGGLLRRIATTAAAPKTATVSSAASTVASRGSRESSYVLTPADFIQNAFQLRMSKRIPALVVSMAADSEQEFPSDTYGDSDDDEETDEFKTPDITIVGLGPYNPDSITEAGLDAIYASSKFFIRTKEHPAVARFFEEGSELAPETFDNIYNDNEEFEEVYEKIAKRVVDEALAMKQIAMEDEDGFSSGVVYGVPGDPFVAESSVGRILDIAQDKGLKVDVISGVSFIEAAMAAVKLDVLAPKLTIVDALEIAGRQYPPISIGTPALVTQIYRPEIASEIKLCLASIYDEEKLVALVHDAGGENEFVEWMDLWEIDHDPSGRIGLRTCMYIPGADDFFFEPPTTFEDLLELAVIRQGDDGIESELEKGNAEDISDDQVGEGLEVDLKEKGTKPVENLGNGEDGDVESWKDENFDDEAALGLIESSATLAACLQRAGNAVQDLEQFQGDEEGLSDIWDKIEEEEAELTEAFGLTLAELVSQLVAAKEKGLLGENRVSDVMRCAAAALDPNPDVEVELLNTMGNESVEFIENEDDMEGSEEDDGGIAA
mmetsp:Transcript_27752/g.67509  ORF Transcript_27752/g.67509 Transcript_27752/m.67509 type:complete len:578 (-) Transcript_27752:118-1851(-)